MSEPRAWDIGDPEPEGVFSVSSDYLGNEWHETGQAHKTPTGWKFYQDGKTYMDWPELVRRYGPVTEVIVDEG